MAEFINIHTHKIKNTGIELYNARLDDVIAENVRYSLGIHPWDVEEKNLNTSLNLLRNRYDSTFFKAIGEIGIDRAIQTPVEIQKEAFIKQVELANEHNLPVIIHSVRAHSDILQVKKQFKKTTDWIIHGFKGSPIEVKQLTDNGICLSFGSSILNHSKSELAIKNTPLEYLFLETDESEYPIEDIYIKASSILKLNLEMLKIIIYVNYVRVFVE